MYKYLTCQNVGAFQDIEKLAQYSMQSNFDPISETHLMNFLHQNYGLEVFTPGLERTKNIFGPLVSKIKQDGTNVIIIAGTNGKGQTAHTLTQLFLSSGNSVALWTSPHILSIRERFQFNGEDIGYKELEIEMRNAHKIATGVSFYEFLFLVFLQLCIKQNKIDYLVLEVGLGGRLDAVNHFDADCAAITSISRDHQNILGHALKEILGEKIAVSRENRPLFSSFSLEYLNDLTLKYCTENKIQWKKLRPEGDYFKSNIQMAEAIFHYFLPDQKVVKNFLKTPFKGRHEMMTFRGNTLIFIGAHNVEGMRKMLAHFSLENNLDVVLFSFSKRSKREIEVMLQMLTNFSMKNLEMWPTVFNHPKAIDRDVIEKSSKEFISDWRAKLESFATTHKDKKILVCGSYYFIGEVQRFILNS
jgi:dihydrofolate synthase/folylpolyglutamate synthase